jgi:hypothetical protein
LHPIKFDNFVFEIERGEESKKLNLNKNLCLMFIDIEHQYIS